MNRAYHSVRLEKERCKGCTTCLKRCPTEAIRVRDGRAHIIDEMCIDWRGNGIRGQRDLVVKSVDLGE